MIKYKFNIRDGILGFVVILLIGNTMMDVDYRLAADKTMDLVVKSLNALQTIHLQQIEIEKLKDQLKEQIFENDYEDHLEYERHLLEENKKLIDMLEYYKKNMV